MRLVMKDKGYSCVPNLLQSQVLQSFLAGGVEPLRHVWVAVRVFWRRSHLHPRHAPPALKLVVGIARGVGLQLEQVPQVWQGEVPLHVLLLVHHAGTEGLLVCLPLEYLLLDGPNRQHPIDEALLLLTVSPHPSHRLLVVGWKQEVDWLRLDWRRVSPGFQSGSNMTSLLAPMRLRPQPPALEDSMKINWLLVGSLNSSTTLALFLMVMDPSSLT